MDAAVLEPPPQRTATAPVLDVQELGVTFGVGNDAARVLRGVSFRIARGEAYGLIGESGSGKTTSAYAVMRYLGGGHATGRILLAGRDVLALPPRELAAIRGRGAAMIYQDPMSALNPAIPVGEQVAEAIRLHHRATRPEAAQRTVALLRQVRLPHPETIVARYPHQLSGGQQQRVVIAMALACAPELLILDEPTTGLDVTTEAVILDLLAELRRTTGIAMLFISHNIGVIARICDRVGVLYAGQLIEEGATADILHAPRHPYTIGLMRALPRSDGPPTRLVAIPGRLPDLRTPPLACIFEARCPLATTGCRTVMPALEPGHAPPGHRSRCHFRDEVAALLPPPPIERLHRPPDPGSRPLLEVVGVEKRFGARPLLPFLRRPTVRAVDDVTITVPPGRTLAVVGESGSGKSTLARCVAGLILPDSGDIRFGNAVLPPLVRRRTKAQQRDIQFVFQNPDAALNPHWTVGQVIGRAVERFADLPASGVRARVAELLEIVNLGARYLDRYPRQLSGGEKQRVGIARAFAGDPRLVICDEPTSALDISVQAAILNQLIALQRLKGTAYLFITHDLGVVRQVADHVAVMQHGRIVEAGEADTIFSTPQAAYTKELLAPGRAH